MITPALVNNFVGSVLWYTALFGVADFAKTSALMPDAIGISDGGANGGGFATWAAELSDGVPRRQKRRPRPVQ